MIAGWYVAIFTPCFTIGSSCGLYVNYITKLFLVSLSIPRERSYINLDAPQSIGFWTNLARRVSFETVKATRRSLLEYTIAKYNVLGITPPDTPVVSGSECVDGLLAPSLTFFVECASLSRPE